MASRVSADAPGDGGGAAEIVEEANGGVHLHQRVVPLGKRSAARKAARFAESVSAPPPLGGGGVHDKVVPASVSPPCGGRDEEVEICLDAVHDTVVVRSVRPVARGEHPGVMLPELEKPASSYGAAHGVLKGSRTRIERSSQELRPAGSLKRADMSLSAVAHALDGLRFISGTTAASAGWDAARAFFRRNAENGLLLPRSMFGECIGMKESEFAGELFDVLARRRGISGDSIDEAELREFWDQISDPCIDGRLQLFFDLMDKNNDGRISVEEVTKIITLSASANKLTMNTQQSEASARLVMEKLDPDGLGYIELYNLKMLLKEQLGEATTNGGDPSKLRPPSTKPNLLKRWYRGTRYFLKENWRRCWVMLLWLSVCAGLFAWKFMQYRRRRAVFGVMGYCVCVAKGGAETLKLNMALTLLPVCRNAVTWLRSRTAAGRFVPFDDSVNFHKAIAAGITVGAGLHVVSHLACDFPRLLRATGDEYEPMKPFFGDVQPPSYWWFLRGTEGWTGLAMTALMAIAFTLATGRLRGGKLRIPLPKKKKPERLPESTKPDTLPRPLVDRLVAFVNASLERFTGYNAFLYTHHLFVVVYALLLVHGHFLYLTNKWQKKTTWMYLAAPMMVYGCERLTRTLRSRVRAVKKVKAAVHPHPAGLLSLRLSKPEGFTYQSGQYIFVKCPNVSSFEWHPFSITSAPEDDYISVHIKVLGDWTRRLSDAFLQVCQSSGAENEIPRVEYDHHDVMPNPKDGATYPTVLIDGPYGAPAQDYRQYEVVLLVGLGIGATPMISIVKDIMSNIKRLRLGGGDVESGNPGDGEAFRTRRAYFYWVTPQQGSLEWFRGIMDEVAAETDMKGTIELHAHCTSVHEEGDARSVPITIVQALNYAVNGTDIISGGRVKTEFARAKWRQVYQRVASENKDKRVGVFYCGQPTLTKELRELAKEFSMTGTEFEFHKENF